MASLLEGPGRTRSIRGGPPERERQALACRTREGAHRQGAAGSWVLHFQEFRFQPEFLEMKDARPLALQGQGLARSSAENQQNHGSGTRDFDAFRLCGILEIANTSNLRRNQGT